MCGIREVTVLLLGELCVHVCQKAEAESTWQTWRFAKALAARQGGVPALCVIVSRTPTWDEIGRIHLRLSSCTIIATLYAVSATASVRNQLPRSDLTHQTHHDRSQRYLYSSRRRAFLHGCSIQRVAATAQASSFNQKRSTLSQ